MARSVIFRHVRDNEVRLQLHALAYNLATFLRCVELPEAMADRSLVSLQLKLINIGARMARHVRAITFQLAQVAVTAAMVRAILAAIRRLRPPPSGACSLEPQKLNETGSTSLRAAPKGPVAGPSTRVQSFRRRRRTVNGSKYLISRQNPAMLLSNGRPLGECRYDWRSLMPNNPYLTPEAAGRIDVVRDDKRTTGMLEAFPLERIILAIDSIVEPTVYDYMPESICSALSEVADRFGPDGLGIYKKCLIVRMIDAMPAKIEALKLPQSVLDLYSDMLDFVARTLAEMPDEQYLLGNDNICELRLTATRSIPCGAGIVVERRYFVVMRALRGVLSGVC